MCLKAPPPSSSSASGPAVPSGKETHAETSLENGLLPSQRSFPQLSLRPLPRCFTSGAESLFQSENRNLDAPGTAARLRVPSSLPAGGGMVVRSPRNERVTDAHSSQGLPSGHTVVPEEAGELPGPCQGARTPRTALPRTLPARLRPSSSHCPSCSLASWSSSSAPYSRLSPHICVPTPWACLALSPPPGCRCRGSHTLQEAGAPGPWSCA